MSSGIIDPDEEMCKFEPDYSFLGISLGVVGMVSVLMEAAERNFEKGTTPNTINTIDFDACSKLMEVSGPLSDVSVCLPPLLSPPLPSPSSCSDDARSPAKSSKSRRSSQTITLT